MVNLFGGILGLGTSLTHDIGLLGHLDGLMAHFLWSLDEHMDILSHLGLIRVISLSLITSPKF